MVTIPEVVEEIIIRSPFLEEALAQGVVNLSALARRIKPQIESKLYKDIQEGAVVMALKRLSSKLKKQPTPSPTQFKIGDITVRSSLIEFTFTNSPALFAKQKQLLELSLKQHNLFVSLSEGVYETTLFASTSLENKIKEIFAGEEIRSTFNNLSSITLILPKEAVYVPGVYYNILKMLAWEGINFIEVVSSYTELTIFLENDHVDRAFSTLKKLS